MKLLSVADSYYRLTVICQMSYSYYYDMIDNAHIASYFRTSLFIIMSFIYSKLLVVVCIAYVISEVVTHKLPLYYYEGFFTYLYGMSILFLLYVFCFLLQESACCARGSDTPPPPPRPPKAGWAAKEPKDKNKKKDKKEKDQKQSKNKKETQVL